MDVILLGNYPNDESESMNRYAEMLRKLLVEQGDHAEIIRPEPFFGRLKKSGYGFGKWLGYIDKYVLFPIILRKYLRRWKSDRAGSFLVHICDHSNAVYSNWLWEIPHLVTCHDVFAIQCARGMISGRSTGWTGKMLQKWILSGLRSAPYVVCVSFETQQDLLALAPELKDRCTVIENPLHFPFIPMAETQADAELSPLLLGSGFRPGKDRFIFHVGGNQWYKNREGVIRIYASLRARHPDLVQERSLKLIMAGKPPTEELQRLVRNEGLGDSVFFLTDVSDQQLCALYSQAEMLVYPSLKEGFGWPIIEAQACGCIVVTTDLAPMNRLAGSAGLLANPEDTDDFVARILQLLAEKPFVRLQRKHRAIQHAEGFNPEIFLKKIKNVYARIARVQ